MIYTTLGSGTLQPSATRHSAAHLVECSGASVLFDIGFGTVHGFARHGVAWASLTHVVLSHFHLDHVGDLAAYLFALRYGVPEGREHPLVLVGPPGFRQVLRGLATAHGDWVTDPPFPLEVIEVERRGRVADAGGRFELVCHPVPHTPESVAWKLVAEDGVFGYTGDTGPDDEAADFLAGSDLLVCECAVPDGSDVEIHLTPSQVARWASRAGPEVLVLTHVYPPLVPHETPHLVARAGYEGLVVAAADGDRFEIRSGRARAVARP